MQVEMKGLYLFIATGIVLEELAVSLSLILFIVILYLGSCYNCGSNVAQGAVTILASS